MASGVNAWLRRGGRSVTLLVFVIQAETEGVLTNSCITWLCNKVQVRHVQLRIESSNVRLLPVSPFFFLSFFVSPSVVGTVGGLCDVLIHSLESSQTGAQFHYSGIKQEQSEESEPLGFW